ncbi:hypothetical protein SAMN06297358_1738 [Pedobacter xixiisoli]|uniref:Uncharacterized protein n=1 Tax=Pedobacter xixiisoli TaxID=1476464 RepID=A0A285ZYS2_9SPHI|nr:hypothetical protein SAMN06297358_1738 [Pedobacter xixiisoli]
MLARQAEIAANMRKKSRYYKKPIIIVTAVIGLQLVFGFDPKFCIINFIWLFV